MRDLPLGSDEAAAAEEADEAEPDEEAGRSFMADMSVCCRIMIW